MKAISWTALLIAAAIAGAFFWVGETWLGLGIIDLLAEVTLSTIFIILWVGTPTAVVWLITRPNKEQWSKPLTQVGIIVYHSSAIIMIAVHMWGQYSVSSELAETKKQFRELRAGDNCQPLLENRAKILNDREATMVNSGWRLSRDGNECWGVYLSTSTSLLQILVLALAALTLFLLNQWGDSAAIKIQLGKKTIQRVT